MSQVSSGLNPVRIESKRLPFQNEDHSGRCPHLLPVCLCLNPGMSPERFWSEPGNVGSDEIPSNSERLPKCHFRSN